MQQTPNLAPQILVAIPKDWGQDDLKKLQDFLISKDVLPILATTYEEAEQIIKTYNLRGIIIFAEWVLAKERELLKLLDDGLKIPTLFIVESKNFDKFFDWYNAHYSPLEEYVHAIFDLDELFLRMKQIKMLD
jgi:hypothetical protein